MGITCCEILLLLTYPENAESLSDNRGPVVLPWTRPEEGPGATVEATQLPVLSGGVCYQSQSNSRPDVVPTAHCKFQVHHIFRTIRRT